MARKQRLLHVDESTRRFSVRTRLCAGCLVEIAYFSRNGRDAYAADVDHADWCLMPLARAAQAASTRQIA